MGHQMLLTKFYPDRLMATKFKTKWAIPRLVQEISPRSVHLTEVRVEGLAITWRQSKSTTPNLNF